MKKEAGKYKVGRWAFLIGILVAVIASFISAYTAQMNLVLFVLGLIVGYLNVSEAESVKFLIAAITLIVGGTAFSQILKNAYLITILGNFIIFVTAAAFIISLKVVFETSEN